MSEADMVGTRLDREAGLVKVRAIQADPAGRMLAESLGVPTPLPNKETRAGDNLALLAIGPGEWLVRCRSAATAECIARIELALKPYVSLVLDISAGRASFMVERDSANRLIGLSPVDLSIGAFTAGSVARTLVGGVPVLIIREATGFRVVVDQSIAASFTSILARGTLPPRFTVDRSAVDAVRIA